MRREEDSGEQGERSYSFTQLLHNNELEVERNSGIRWIQNHKFPRLSYREAAENALSSELRETSCAETQRSFADLRNKHVRRANESRKFRQIFGVPGSLPCFRKNFLQNRMKRYPIHLRTKRFHTPLFTRNTKMSFLS
ncbi:hypothetical protein WN55_00344 [Dufourea novaeangliae]|uniref:Uncharacterized protein n=1 Tax=Dufourea novaeangliae TaxID=178035 RepID=A0A154PFK4_DUFNO|nr:hypothetical protein WN55_00344 [Dufourea novaeangliae]